MDTQGNIYKIGEEQDSVKDAKELMTLLTEKEAEYLKQFKQSDRPIIFHGLTSKNRSAKKRANKKIAKASRQRNRR